MLLAKFLDLWIRLSKGRLAVPSVSDFEQRHRELIEQKKVELGSKYAHHPKNYVGRKDGRVYKTCARYRGLVLVRD